MSAPTLDSLSVGALYSRKVVNMTAYCDEDRRLMGDDADKIRLNCFECDIADRAGVDGVDVDVVRVLQSRSCLHCYSFGRHFLCCTISF